MTEDMINCGTCTVQVLGRISIVRHLAPNDISVGDRVEVFIKPVRRDDG